MDGLDRYKQILYFKNQGKKAGASIVHPHSQIVALPFLPDYVDHRLDFLTKQYEKYGRPAMDVMVEREMEDKSR